MNFAAAAQGYNLANFVAVPQGQHAGNLPCLALIEIDIDMSLWPFGFARPRVIIRIQKRQDGFKLGGVIVMGVGDNHMVDIAKPSTGLCKNLKEIKSGIHHDAHAAMPQVVATSRAMARQARGQPA